jgi:hypothetical protein
MHPRLRRVRDAVLTAVLVAPAFATVLTFTAPPVAADTNQDNGCLGVTGTFSTFPIPITGTASPKTIDADKDTTLSNTGITVNVTSGLVVAGVNTGLVQAAPTLADVGTAGGSNGTLQGENAVSVIAGGIKLAVQGTNTSQGTQTAQNASAINFTFWTVNDGTTITVYTGTPNPPSNSNLVDVTAQGIPVKAALADTTWTGIGGSLALREANTQPSSLTAPTLADKNAAPLQILSKINNAVNVKFYCWPGTASASGNALVPLGAGPTSAIDTVTVIGGSATTSTSTTSTTLARSTTTTTAAPATTTTSPPGAVPTPVTGTRTYAAECSNTVNTSMSTITFTATGTTTANLAAGDPVPLTGQTWKVDVPGAVLDTGINLGLINPGDMIRGSLKAGVNGGGTAEGTTTAAPIDLTLGPVTVDAVTGLADPVSTTVTLPDSTWTAASSTMPFSMGPSVVDVKIPIPGGTPLTVTFTCQPPSDAAPFVTASLAGDPPAAVAGTVTASSAQVEGASVVRAAELPRTGPARGWLLVELTGGLALLDAGYLLWSATRRKRARKA